MADHSARFEAQHVHLVYEHIASDFSRTRHSTWPFVQQWLQRLNENSLILDAGCGNGKYLGVDSVLSSSDRPGPIPPHVVHKNNGMKPKGQQVVSKVDGMPTSRTGRQGKADSEPAELEPTTRARDLDRTSLDPPRSESASSKSNKAILSIGLDMSLGLLSIASKEKGHEVVRGDCFDLGCWRIGAFDHAISIATIHHFATQARRIESIKQLIKLITPSPNSTLNSPHKLLIVVWALEQDPALSGFGSARKKGKVKGGAVRVDEFLVVHESKEEGVGDELNEGKVGREDERDVFVPWELQRKEEGIAKVKGTRREKAGKMGKGPPQDEETVEKAEAQSVNVVEDETPAKIKEQTFQRYYHLFKHGELTDLVKAAAKELGACFEGAAEVDAEGEKSIGAMGELITEEDERRVLRVRMKEERWERENWVGDIELEWTSGSARGR